MTFFQRIRTPFAENPADEQARLQPRMRLVGELLQERREDLGLYLDEIGAMLRIKPAYLAALEQGRLHELPGPTYAIGFIRAYAEFLGLDSEPVLARFKEEASGVTARPDLALPVPLGERSLPGGTLVLVALIMGLCGYGIWYYLSTEERNRPERVAAVPAALLPQQQAPQLVPPPPPPTVPAPSGAQDAAPGTSPNLNGAASQTSSGATTASAGAPPAPSSSATPAASASQPAPVSPQTPPASAAPLLNVPTNLASHPGAPAPAASPAGTSPQVASLPPPTPAAAPSATPAAVSMPGAAPTPAANAPPANAAAPNGAATTGRISIRALADSWIQVRAGDQSIIFSRVLKSGEIYAVPARPGLSLRTGNAGALEIAVDGKTVPSIGGIGALRRDVALDPAELAAGTAVHG